MESFSDNSPLIVIVGQTASGKSALAMQLAQRFNGEIIAADSRTVYKGMDIGTAKPSVDDQERIRHHLIDVVTPNQAFTVADFQRLARAAIEDISRRGRLPIMVGGTGLYVDSLLYNFGLRPASNPLLRAELQRLSVEELQHRLRQQGIALPANERNPRHLIRSLEAADSPPPTKQNLRRQTLLLGLAVDDTTLQTSIERRAHAMLTDGLVEEARKLFEAYDPEAAAFQTPGYKEFREYLVGRMSLEQAQELFVRAHKQYAKRQKTWFKRNNDIVWISKAEESVDLVTTFLNNML